MPVRYSASTVSTLAFISNIQRIMFVGKVDFYMGIMNEFQSLKFFYLRFLIDVSPNVDIKNSILWR